MGNTPFTIVDTIQISNGLILYEGKMLKLKKPLLAAASITAFGFSPAQALDVDGAFDPFEGYTLELNVTFNLEGGDAVEGGKLFVGKVDGNNNGLQDTGDGYFLYFAMPKEFVDNSIGTNVVDLNLDDNGSGLYKDGSKGHSFKDLLGSDALGRSKDDKSPFELHTSEGTIELTVDYIAEDGKDSGVYEGGRFGEAGTASHKNEGDVISNPTSFDVADIDVATSMEYNINTYGHMENSPEVKQGTCDPANTPGDTSDDVNCDTYEVVDSSFANYQFQVGYEFRFDLDWFTGDWTLASNWVGAGDSLTFISLGESHVSPHRLGKFKGSSLVECEDGCDLPPGGGDQVPAPAALGLLGFGLIGTGILQRRRRSQAS